MRFADGRFDRTISLLVMNHIPDRDKAMAEMVRVTKPGGTVAAAVWDYGGDMEMLRIFWDEAVKLDPKADAKHQRHAPLSKQGELEALWRKSGLTNVEERGLTVRRSYASFAEYWQPFLMGERPGAAYATSLSPEDRARLEQRLRQRLLPDGQDRPFTLKARAWAVKGTVPPG
jgi:SAM-dependent methyltransferase